MKKLVFVLIGVFVVLMMYIYPAVSVSCDINSIREYAIEEGFDRDSLGISDNGEIELFKEKFFFAKMEDGEGNRDTYYVRCDTGEVYDHRPSFQELFGETKISSTLWLMMQESDANEFDIMVFKSSSLPNNVVAKNELANAGMAVLDIRELGEMTSFVGTASREEIGEISNITWVEEVDANIKLYPFTSILEEGGNETLYLIIYVLVLIVLVLVVVIFYFTKRR